MVNLKGKSSVRPKVSKITFCVFHFSKTMKLFSFLSPLVWNWVSAADSSPMKRTGIIYQVIASILGTKFHLPIANTLNHTQYSI